MIRLNAHLGFIFTEVPFEERFHKARKAGFSGVEFPAPYAFDPARFRDLLLENNLEMVQLSTPFQNTRGTAALPKMDNEFKAGLKHATSYANKIGCKRIHLMAGEIDGIQRHTAGKTYIKNLRYAADFLSDHDITALVEVINPLDTPDYYMNNFCLAERVFDAVDRTNIKLILDTYHCSMLNSDLLEVLDQWWGRMGHIQIADFPGRNEPGTGKLNFNDMLRELKRREYNGWIGFEYVPKTTTDESIQKWRLMSSRHCNSGQE